MSARFFEGILAVIAVAALVAVLLFHVGTPKASIQPNIAVYEEE